MSSEVQKNKGNGLVEGTAVREDSLVFWANSLEITINLIGGLSGENSTSEKSNSPELGYPF